MTPLPNDAYWVEQGKIMAGPYPGELVEKEAVRSLTELTDAGVDRFIDLTFPKGVSSDMLEPYAHLLEDLPNGALSNYSRRSIVDLDVPFTGIYAADLEQNREHYCAGRGCLCPLLGRGRAHRNRDCLLELPRFGRHCDLPPKGMTR